MELDADSCYICLEAGGNLARPCTCPRFVHDHCLARWQLQQAGKPEERQCRFCSSVLPDWKGALAPIGLCDAGDGKMLPVEDPPLLLRLGGKVHKVRAKPGPEGEQEFRKLIKKILQEDGYPEDTCFDVTYDIRVPCSGESKESISIQGMSSYEAAIHCVMISSHQSDCSVNSSNTKTASERD